MVSDWVTGARVCATVCLLTALASPFAGAADAPPMVYYRYVDSHGVMVMDRQGVPPEYVAKGYQVVNTQGRVVQTVPPAPTAEEIRKQQAATAQAAADDQLLHTYPSLNELDHAKVRRLAEVDAMVALANGNLQTLKVQQDGLQAQAADVERNGHPVPAELLEQIKGVQAQRADTNARIVNYQAIRQQVDQKFTQDRARLVQLISN